MCVRVRLSRWDEVKLILCITGAAFEFGLEYCTVILRCKKPRS